MKKFTFLTISLILALQVSAQHVLKHMTYDGLNRNYMEYIPTQNLDGSFPVVFCLHGLGDDCANFSEAIGFERTAPNWIIITPEAYPETLSIMGQSLSLGNAWAAGVGAENITFNYGNYNIPIGTININNDVDDEGFLMAILDSLQANYSIDNDSVFFMGFSMGGFMTNKMAIKHGGRINAIASVSGTIGHFETFNPANKVNTMHIHGTADGTVAYEDANFSYGSLGIGSVGTGAEETVEKWYTFNECNTTPEIYNYPNTQNDGMTFEKYTYTSADKKTAFIKVIGGDHNWYSGNTYDIDYNTEIYKFFVGENTTSIKEQRMETLSVYPNPASRYFNIYSDSDSEIVIYNSLLQEVSRQKVNQGDNTISSENLSRGVYFISNDGKSCKLIIE